MKKMFVLLTLAMSALCAMGQAVPDYVLHVSNDTTYVCRSRVFTFYGNVKGRVILRASANTVPCLELEVSSGNASLMEFVNSFPKNTGDASGLEGQKVKIVTGNGSVGVLETVNAKVLKSETDDIGAAPNSVKFVIAMSLGDFTASRVSFETMLGRIAELAASVGAYVLSDEVYLPLEGTDRFLSMADVYDRAIVTNSVSKTYSLPAARTGWVIADEAVSGAIRTMRDYTMISAGVVNDALATYVLAHREQVLERNRAIVLGNRAIAQEWIDAQPRVSWVAPRGVSTSYIRLDIPEDDESFCLRLLEERGVLLVPGSRFELPCGARLGYCAQREVLRRGLELLGEALSEFDR